MNATLPDGTTALMMACKNGHKDVVELLLNHSNPRIDVNAKANNDTTAFIMACKKGHKDIVKLLLERSDIDISAGTETFQEN